MIKVNIATSSGTSNTLFTKDKEHIFLNHIAFPVWESNRPLERLESLSNDGGVTYNDISEEVIFGAYFFLDNIKLIHKMNRYNLGSINGMIKVISDIGGLFASLTLAVTGFMTFWNNYTTASKVIKNTYYS